MTIACPTAHQLQFMDMELGLFLHFGIRTFHEGYRDWDGKPLKLSNFNPSQLDCGQWMKTAIAAGMKYAVLTAKHHDGFANWPSRFTDFSVANTPWKSGKGDVVREFVSACTEFGIKPGLYYSPAQWGGSDTFKDNPKAYDDYFVNQISELLDGRYGEINFLWFDGCGSERHSYDWNRIIGEIRRMQPNIMIFNMGDPDYRWVGNESGLAPRPLWNVVRSVPFSINTQAHENVAAGQERFLPAECDLMLRDSNWFFEEADTHTVKSVEELVGIYYYSVGRGANMLLNVGPDRRGLLPDEDSAVLRYFGTEISRRFGNPLAKLCDFSRDGEVWKWKPAKSVLIDHLVVMEDLSQGDNVRAFDIAVQPYLHRIKNPIVVYEGRNIGHKAICTFPLVRASEVIVRILDSARPATLSDITVHHLPPSLTGSDPNCQASTVITENFAANLV